ncbi:MAG: hypothetical protein POH28_14025 [Acidocella sp.]|nr:hypothetical protein [Acidocella sp.]
MTLKFNSINIITYGRSGSTLLSGILNSIPGVLVRGENNLFIFQLFQSYASLVESKSIPYNAKSGDPTHPWYGIQDVDLEEYIAGCKILIRNVLVPRRLRETGICYGFKEIRYPYIDHLDKFLSFIRSVMPQSAFIFNFRDHEEVIKSGWWANEDKENSLNILRQFEASAMRYASSHEDHSFTIEYPEVASGGLRLREMFGFLGANYDYSLIKSILGRVHSTKTVHDVL